MKITKSQLKEIIREEASRLKKQYILEDKKKAITEELRMLNENECETNCIKVLSLDNGNYSRDYNGEELDDYLYADAIEMSKEKYALNVDMEFIYVDETGKNHKGKITINTPGDYQDLEFQDDNVIDEDQVIRLIDNYRTDTSFVNEPVDDMVNEKEELDMSDIDMPIQDKAVFSAMNDEEVEDDLSDIIAKYTKKGGDYEGGYKDDVSVSPGYLNESNKKGKMKVTKSQLKQIIREEVKNQNLKRYSLHKYLLDNDVCEDVSFLAFLYEWVGEIGRHAFVIAQDKDKDKDKVWNYFKNLPTDKLEKIVNTHKEYEDYSNKQGDLAGEMGLGYSDSLSDEEKEGITIVDKGYENIQSKGIEPYKRKTNYAKNKEAERIKREKFASEFPEEWRKGEDDMFYYIGKEAWEVKQGCGGFQEDEVIPVGDGTFKIAPEAIERYRKPDYVSWKNEINENKMKITKSQLKQIIREEASRLKKQYILEDKKKAIVNELRMLNENFEDLNNATEEEQLAAVKREGDAIYYIKNPSEVVQLAAVKDNGYAIQWIKNPSEAVKLAAVQEYGNALTLIDNPSEAVQLAAVNIYSGAIRFFKNPTEAVKVAAAIKAEKEAEY